MKIQISGNLLQHYLQNVYFINGHSYAGKSTMVRMLAERYDMIQCGENYHDVFPRNKLSRWKQPGLCYFDTMSGWREWLNMTPEEHWNWTDQVSLECMEIEILELVRLAASGKKVINVDDKYLNIAEKFLYGEFAVALGLPKDEVKGYISGYLKRES